MATASVLMQRLFFIHTACPSQAARLRVVSTLGPALVGKEAWLLGPKGRASPSPSQLLAFAPTKEQAAGVWAT